MRPSIELTEVQIRTPSIGRALHTPPQSPERPRSRGHFRNNETPLPTPPNSPPTVYTKVTQYEASPQPTPPSPAVSRPPLTRSESSPAPWARNAADQAAPAAAPQVVYAAPPPQTIIIELRHSFAPAPATAAAPAAAATVAPEAPASKPEPEATTWWGKTWQKSRDPLFTLAWALMQILAAINIPVIFNFQKSRPA